MKYKWKNGNRVKGNADVIGNHLEFMQVKHGELTADLLLKDAKKKTSPLHGLFDWNDETAAHAYRLVQAREILRSIEVVYQENKNTEETVRAYHVIKYEDTQAYEHVTDILNDPEKREQLIETAKQKFLDLKRKHAHLHELAKFVESMGKEWKAEYKTVSVESKTQTSS